MYIEKIEIKLQNVVDYSGGSSKFSGGGGVATQVCTFPPKKGVDDPKMRKNDLSEKFNQRRWRCCKPRNPSPIF